MIWKPGGILFMPNLVEFVSFVDSFLRAKLESRSEEIVHDLRVRLPARLPHDLADEEPDESLLARPKGLDLSRVRRNNTVNHLLELRLIADLLQPFGRYNLLRILARLIHFLEDFL